MIIIYCIIATIVIYIATDFIIELINYKAFKKKLVPGTKLTKTIKCIGNEFDPGTTQENHRLKYSILMVQKI